VGLDLPVVELRRVDKVVGRELVLKGVSLKVRPGRIVVVRGRSGVGKTTLAKLASLLERPSSGKIIFLGQDVTYCSDELLSALRLKHVGYVDQFFKLIPTMTVLENVELPLALMGVPKRRRRLKALEVLDELGLRGKAYRLPEELSGGERQRIAIARALVKDPLVLIGDEILSNLDEFTSHYVVDLIRRRAREEGMGVLITTTDFGYDFGADEDYTLINGELHRVDA